MAHWLAVCVLPRSSLALATGELSQRDLSHHLQTIDSPKGCAHGKRGYEPMRYLQSSVWQLLTTSSRHCIHSTMEMEDLDAWSQPCSS